ncbi:MAG: hypothetical protein GVY18_10420 [Bacteroidetes bacterium]|jgi:hypothetical protein|nr:hypothetical protein [Bacteroidota bacterium]
MGDLEEKIARNLEESGFGSEMQAARLLFDRHWLVTSGHTYFDNDEQITRELDLKANCSRRAIADGKPIITVSIFLAVEVKKSSKPWVVLRYEKSDDLGLGGGWLQLIETSNLPYTGFQFTRHLKALSLGPELGWSGYGVHEAFSSPDKPSRWWAATVTSVKAAEHLVKGLRMKLGNQTEEPVSDLRASPCFINLVRPVVLLDGKLFSAYIDAQASIIVEEVKFAPYEFRFQTPNYSERRAYYPEIVTLHGLADYSQRLEERLEDLIGVIASKAMLSDEEWELNRAPIDH